MKAESNEEAMSEIGKREAESSSEMFDKDYILTRMGVRDDFRTWESAEHLWRDSARGVEPVDLCLLYLGSVPCSSLRSGFSFLRISFRVLPFNVTFLAVVRIITKARISGRDGIYADISVG